MNLFLPLIVVAIVVFAAPVEKKLSEQPTFVTDVDGAYVQVTGRLQCYISHNDKKRYEEPLKSLPVHKFCATAHFNDDEEGISFPWTYDATKVEQFSEDIREMTLPFDDQTFEIGSEKTRIRSLLCGRNLCNYPRNMTKFALTIDAKIAANIVTLPPRH